MEGIECYELVCTPKYGDQADFGIVTSVGDFAITENKRNFSAEECILINNIQNGRSL